VSETNALTALETEVLVIRPRKEGIAKLAKMAMMAMITSNSVSVNPCG
jgi:hypothetical protein